MLDSAGTIAAFAREMSEFLKNSELTETRAFVRSFVKEVVVRPGWAGHFLHDSTPGDSPIGARTPPRSLSSRRVVGMVCAGGFRGGHGRLFAAASASLVSRQRSACSRTRSSRLARSGAKPRWCFSQPNSRSTADLAWYSRLNVLLPLSIGPLPVPLFFRAATTANTPRASQAW